MFNLIVCTVLLFAPAEKMNRLVDLRGTWKFELGDDKRWANPSYNDSDWQDMFVPANWEEEGFPEYNGYAWYRKHFKIEADVDAEVLYINLGQIDDVDATYLNGKFIGQSGGFPPHSQTAYNQERSYPVPIEYFNLNGDNLLAVRVFDEYEWGGIVAGRPGVFESTNDLDYNMAGPWLFQIGDDSDWKDEGYDDRDWEQLMVPGKWENQGLNDYDGHGWYRKKFNLPNSLGNEELVLLLGKIDDVDEAFLNGEKIGRTGKIGRMWRSGYEDAYNEIRAYDIPSGLLKFGRKNTLAVHVYDWGGFGGIYEAPIGIVTQKRYHQLKRNWSNDKSFWDLDIFK